MVDWSAQWALRNMISIAGEQVTFQRLTGFDSSTTAISATIMARVGGLSAETTEVSQTGYGASQTGALSQTSRRILVVAADLSAAGFPLPVKKNDKVILADGTKATVLAVDAHKRTLTGGIELRVAEVA